MCQVDKDLHSSPYAEYRAMKIMALKEEDYYLKHSGPRGNIESSFP